MKNELRFASSGFKLGIIAGGQLGKMLALAASNWDIATYTLDPDEACAARPVCKGYTKGSFKDYQAVYDFGRKMDMITLEIEHVNVEALHQLNEEGIPVFPDPGILRIIQDKGLQKKFYHKHQLPTAAFTFYEDAAEISTALQDGQLGYPFVQKSRKAGYDGQGVAIIRSPEDDKKLLNVPSITEEAVHIHKELSVITARDQRGNIRSFPVVEMEFNPEANLVEMLLCPAAIDEKTSREAMELAEAVIEAFDMTGMLAVEMFLDNKGNLWVNEVAPRPHNSGHHSIESMITSQYEQNLRLILGLPLGSTTMKMPSVMVNLLGAPGHMGEPYYEGLDQALGIEGVKVHIYGKKQTRPFRKMGHVSILAPRLEEAIEKAKEVKKLIKVTAWEQQASVS